MPICVLSCYEIMCIRILLLKEYLHVSVFVSYPCLGILQCDECFCSSVDDELVKDMSAYS